jgi:hypothetical protein
LLVLPQGVIQDDPGDGCRAQRPAQDHRGSVIAVGARNLDLGRPRLISNSWPSTKLALVPTVNCMFPPWPDAKAAISAGAPGNPGTPAAMPSGLIQIWMLLPTANW